MLSPIDSNIDKPGFLLLDRYFFSLSLFQLARNLRIIEVEADEIRLGHVPVHKGLQDEGRESAW